VCGMAEFGNSASETAFENMKTYG